MTCSTHFVSFLSICFFSSLIYFATSLENNNSSVERAYKNSLNKDESHENMHSQSAKKSDVVAKLSNNNETSNFGLIQDPHKTIKRILNYTDKILPEKISQNDSNFIATEGGSLSLSPISNKKTDHDNNTLNLSVISKNNSLLVTGLPQTSTDKKNYLFSLHKINTSAEKSKSKLNPVTSSVESYSSVSPATMNKLKKKPVFLIVPSEEDDIDSFIESSTTGRDFVLPIVLCILALPLVGYIGKLIYRRGTEFTERQQYHRMYLIDGMYNSR